MKEIENDDYSFLNYLLLEQNSFVLNVRKGAGNISPALHRSWCPKIRTRKSTDRLSPFTGQGYKKVVSSKYSDIEQWLESNLRNQESVKLCSHCSPLENIVPKSLPSPELIDIHSEQEYLVGKLLTDDEINQKVQELNSKPKRKKVSTYRYERNPYVVQAVLRRANGICECCFKKAPFNRSSDGSPFLEVHHVNALSDGGHDIVKNCLAVCPNCHRKAHFG